MSNKHRGPYGRGDAAARRLPPNLHDLLQDIGSEAVERLLFGFAEPSAGGQRGRQWGKWLAGTEPGCCVRWKESPLGQPLPTKKWGNDGPLHTGVVLGLVCPDYFPEAGKQPLGVLSFVTGDVHVVPAEHTRGMDERGFRKWASLRLHNWQQSQRMSRRGGTATGRWHGGPRGQRPSVKVHDEVQTGPYGTGDGPTEAWFAKPEGVLRAGTSSTDKLHLRGVSRDEMNPLVVVLAHSRPLSAAEMDALQVHSNSWQIESESGKIEVINWGRTWPVWLRLSRRPTDDELRQLHVYLRLLYDAPDVRSRGEGNVPPPAPAWDDSMVRADGSVREPPRSADAGRATKQPDDGGATDDRRWAHYKSALVQDGMEPERALQRVAFHRMLCELVECLSNPGPLSTAHVLRDGLADFADRYNID